ncbi:hypothetical protein NC653_014333 [Populus alba x Populus x berolinensis]|uniref:Uncharacterized protein n=1 Tax=Populus alba x Populus x berolinensis TaxID=444605 RepID=A0AAD6QWR3_9ROSI|nr:hypothetical protein NC653_014333 [Populus alba x Populus x berolinensis]
MAATTKERFEVRIMMRRIRDDDALAHSTKAVHWDQILCVKIRKSFSNSGVNPWEDGYYDNCEQHDALENKCIMQTQENLHGGHYPRDPLGLAVGKDVLTMYTLSESSLMAGKVSFLLGIRTIVVLAVVPMEVVQHGSLNKVIEGM